MARVGRHAGGCAGLVALLGCLAPVLALAAEPRFLVLWSSSTTAEEANKALAEVKSAPWANMLELGEGYPKVEESAKIDGLKPGAWVVALGACAKVDEGGATTELLRAVGRAFSVPVKAYVRKTQDQRPLACPEFLPLREGADEEDFFRMTYGTRSLRHKLEFFHVPWPQGQPPSLPEGQEPIVVILMVDGRAADGRLAPLDTSFLGALQSDHSPLLQVERPDTPTSSVTLLRERGDSDGDRFLKCQAINERSTRDGPEVPDDTAPPPSTFEDHYAVFELSELRITWSDRRLLKVRRKPLGFKCCMVYSDYCEDSVVLEPKK